jgi:hypothetical protein
MLTSHLLKVKEKYTMGKTSLNGDNLLVEGVYF